jgi:opacity protein-like surface antigen
LTSSLRDTRFGLVYGAGLEMKFAPSISARVEGLHYSYKDQTLGYGPVSTTIRQDSTVLRAGVTYHFN